MPAFKITGELIRTYTLSVTVKAQNEEKAEEKATKLFEAFAATFLAKEEGQSEVTIIDESEDLSDMIVNEA